MDGWVGKDLMACWPGWPGQQVRLKGFKRVFPSVTPVFHLRIFKTRNIKTTLIVTFLCTFVLCNNRFIKMDFYGAASSSVLLLWRMFTSCTFLIYFSSDNLLDAVWGRGVHQRAHFSADELVPCSACAHQFMLGLETRPRPAGAQSDAALPGFQSSYLPLPNRKGQDFSLSRDAHILCCTTRFHHVIRFLLK